MLMLTPTKEIRLRDYQSESVEALREGIRQGRKRQVLVAPTGAGKTVIASHLLRQADEKGSYSLFLVDRVALVDQTSATLDDYGIRHGIVQGINERWMPSENVQVCSIQTLARRILPRRPSLIIYDEAHAMYQSSLEFIAAHPEAVAIGLTATPFTPGMGKHWSGLVNVTTTRKLIDTGFLIEPTIYVAKSPEDAELGANGFGEFTDSSASSAGIRIVGDVVHEWVKKTSEHFGGPVKTIVFSPTVEHGREICAAFGAAGFNFQQISYLDRSDAERAEKIAEFRRPDSIIHGLVSCGVLTKGFDVADVRCIASGSLVLTDKGPVPIEKVTLDHKLWDGIEFVEHQGVIFKGYRDVIEYAGLTATPDHEVHTPQGWRSLGDCAAKQIPITQTGFDGRPVRWDAGYFAGNSLEESWSLGSRKRPVRVRPLWSAFGKGSVLPTIYAAQTRLSGLLSENDGRSRQGRPAVAGAQSGEHESALRTVVAQGISRLWWARDRVSVFVSAILRRMGNRELGLAQTGQQHATGSHQERWALRARQSQVGIQSTELQQYTSRRLGGYDASVQDRASRNPLCRQDSAQPVHHGVNLRSGSGTVLHSVRQTKRPVWDILQAGPRNRFTCEGLLVHNCGISCKPYRKSLSSHLQEIGRVMRPIIGEQKKAIWLDHSGNIERFAFDMFDVWDNGVGDLSKAEKRDSEPRKRDEATREKSVCPECSGALRGNFCMACGWEKPARSGIVAVEGALHEFDPAALGLTARAGLRAECLKDPRSVWDAALAYCMDHCPRDETKARKWAYGCWRGIYPGSKLPNGWFDASRKSYDQNAYALIDRETKRYRKNRRFAA